MGVLLNLLRDLQPSWLASQSTTQGKRCCCLEQQASWERYRSNWKVTHAHHNPARRCCLGMFQVDSCYSNRRNKCKKCGTLLTWRPCGNQVESLTRKIILGVLYPFMVAYFKLSASVHSLTAHSVSEIFHMTTPL